MMPVELVVSVPALLKPALLDEGLVLRIELALDEGVRLRVVALSPPDEDEPKPEYPALVLVDAVVGTPDVPE